MEYIIEVNGGGRHKFEADSHYEAAGAYTKALTPPEGTSFSTEAGGERKVWIVGEHPCGGLMNLRVK